MKHLLQVSGLLCADPRDRGPCPPSGSGLTTRTRVPGPEKSRTTAPRAERPGTRSACHPVPLAYRLETEHGPQPWQCKVDHEGHSRPRQHGVELTGPPPDELDEGIGNETGSA